MKKHSLWHPNNIKQDPHCINRFDWPHPGCVFKSRLSNHLYSSRSFRQWCWTVFSLSVYLKLGTFSTKSNNCRLLYICILNMVPILDIKKKRSWHVPLISMYYTNFNFKLTNKMSKLWLVQKNNSQAWKFKQVARRYAKLCQAVFICSISNNYMVQLTSFINNDK